MNNELQKKVDRALWLIEAGAKAAYKYGQPLEIAYSGGKDSDVILELARMSGADYRAIYKNTTIDPPGTIKHVREKGVEVVRPKMSFRELVKSKGMPTRWRRFCCSVLKEYKILDYAVVGIRREESRKRSKIYHEPEVCRVYRKSETAQILLPILDWTGKDVAEFLTEQHVKCHPLYYDEKGYFHTERRLGCMCCPLMSRQKRIAEFKKYPKMVQFYIKALNEYMDYHPNSKTAKIFRNPYDLFTSVVFCDGERQFRESFGALPIFGNDAIDTKSFLEQQFNIELTL